MHTGMVPIIEDYFKALHCIAYGNFSSYRSDGQHRIHA